MHTAQLIVTSVAIVVNAFIAAADLVRAPFVLKTSAAVGVPGSWLTGLGLLKAAGAVGLLLGLLGFPVLGVAAAIGLVLFYLGAIGAHLRVGDHSATLGFPLAFLLVAAAALGLGLTG